MAKTNEDKIIIRDKVRTILIRGLQGSEEEFEKRLVNFLNKGKKEIMFTESWTMGIDFYILICYKMVV